MAKAQVHAKYLSVFNWTIIFFKTFDFRTATFKVSSILRQK